MNIGIYSPYLHSLSGGERYILTLASYWSRIHTVSLFWHDREIKKTVWDRLHIDITRIHVVDNIFQNNILARLMKSSSYDVILIVSDGSIPLTLAKKSILHFQSPFFRVNGQSIENRIKLMKYQRIVCNSMFTKRFIDREYGASSQVIYPPVSVREYKSADKKKSILSVGRFHQYKKQREMISIFKTMKILQWELWLAGGLLPNDQDYYRRLQDEARGVPVKFFPNVSFEELVNLYATACLYWHAAGFGENERDHPERFEHFGISTVEAMAAGAVPIVFRGGGLPEIVEHGKTGFLWSTGEDLKRQTKLLIHDKSLCEKQSLQAIGRAKVFDESKFLQSFNEVLASIFA